MTASHDFGPELRQLAQTILERLDPAVRTVAAMAAESLRGPSRCEQVWCPVCALAALVQGEQHPMLNVIAEHSVTLMTVIRSMAADPAAQTQAPDKADDGAADADSKQNANGRYQPIPIVVEPPVD